MILIGQFDSPFVRRVAVALQVYGLSYQHRPWSVFGDGERIAAFNPLRRVPVLVLDQGEALIESGAILDYLDELSKERSLAIRYGHGRHRMLRLCALATGLADKAVSLVYERVIHERSTPAWVERCRAQMTGALDALEESRAAARTPWLFGSDLSHADIMIACSLRFIREAHARMMEMANWPNLAAHAAVCEGLPAFRAVSQPFQVPPATPD